MSVRDVAGVFSRYFIIGFFVPAWATLVAIYALGSAHLRPDRFASESAGSQIIVLGGLALLTGLLLSGFHFPILRILEGYPLEDNKDRRLLRWVYETSIRRQEDCWKNLRDIRDDKELPRLKRGQAAWELDQSYPHEQEVLLPTRFGNVIRAFEYHPRERWGLDGIAVWPRIELLLSSGELDGCDSVKGDVAFFVNLMIGVLFTSVTLTIDEVVNRPHPLYSSIFFVMLMVVIWPLYSGSVSAAGRWGAVVRGAIDIHRRDLYERLGVVTPTTDSEERKVANAINDCILFGLPLPDSVRRPPPRPRSSSAPS
jgi:hypothetical protein